MRLGSEIFQDIAKINGIGRSYYKISGGRSLKEGSDSGFSIVQFKDDKNNKIEYFDKIGKIEKDEFQALNSSFTLSPNDKSDNQKSSTSLPEKHEEELEKEWQNGAHFYMPAYRYEEPFWKNEAYFDTRSFKDEKMYYRQYGKDLEILSSTKENKMYIMDLFFDLVCYKNDTDVEKWENINDIIKKIKQKDNIIFGISRRNDSSRILIMYEDNKEKLCDIDSLSLGESVLLNLFINILRYANESNLPLEQIKGLVIIDEIDAHLHSDLQSKVLPELIKVFPKIQFVITTHSPLFILGMQKEFGEDGFDLFNMPNGEKITAERFSEFQKAYIYFKNTQQHEKEIYEAISSKKDKMLVVTEGSTDWKHMKAAYNKLSQMPEHKDLFSNFDFEFFEYEPKNSKVESNLKSEMGNKALESLCKSVSKINRDGKIVCIADRDADVKLGGNEKEYKFWGNNVFSFLIPVPDIRKENPNICIEHLYPDEIIKTEVTDSENNISRRLFMGNEFDERGISSTLNMICTKNSVCGENEISIIDGSSHDKVTKMEDKDTNLALSKMVFANMILEKKDPFNDIDFSNFVKIFIILKEIYNEK
ncbi:MAG: AAA family ATPase [Campylobacter sp.]|nr:AAA family ATPase [Campylobacter sp.]MDY3775743.1 AAA family ATPase [Campylobacter sp.]MDY4012641.1 AAA family ATPase [Campylobacter sp.]